MYIKITNHENIGYNLDNPEGNCFRHAVGRAAEFCLNSRVFSLLTLGHLHTLIHEMGHAVAYRILTGGEATINLSTSSLGGFTTFHSGKRSLSRLGSTWVALSGALADIIFSTVLITGIFALTHYIPMSNALSLGLRIGIGVPAAVWIIGELFYATVSACNRDEGDFGSIAQEGGRAHVLVSTAILVSICGLCVLSVALLV